MDPHLKLKEWRGRDSLATAGRRIGCDPSLLRKLENRSENRKPGLDLAIRIRNVVGIPVEAWSEPTEAKPSSADSGEIEAVVPESERSEPAA